MSGPFLPIGIVFLTVGAVGLAMGDAVTGSFIGIGIAFMAVAIARKQQAKEAEGEGQD